jgi:hypothetical protein
VIAVAELVETTLAEGNNKQRLTINKQRLTTNN